jgi:hypothetical protein
MGSAHLPKREFFTLAKNGSRTMTLPHTGIDFARLFQAMAPVPRFYLTVCGYLGRKFMVRKRLITVRKVCGQYVWAPRGVVAPGGDIARAIAQALAEFAYQECANYIANLGYRHVS